jgi:hypothetical protein
MAETPTPPIALYMTVSDDVLTDTPAKGKVTVSGLISRVDWPSGSTTPLRLEKLAVLLVLTGGRGSGKARVVCINEETGVPAFQVQAPISFKDNSPGTRPRDPPDQKLPIPGARRLPLPVPVRGRPSGAARHYGEVNP